MQKKGLGKGLGALIPGVEETRERGQFEVEVDRITPNPLQPRRAFDQAKIEELAASMRDQGVIQPLLVRRRGEHYELIAGERRWRAAMHAGLNQVPVVVKDASDLEALQLALIENLQREDLNPIEQAAAYQQLQRDFGLSQEEVAAKVGKSRPSVANSLRLLLLPKAVQDEVVQGRLPAGQARALLALQDEAAIVAAAREVIAKALSTRQTERLVARLRSGRRRRRGTLLSDPDLRALVERLQRALGTKVRLIQQAGSSAGKIVIEYYSATDLERILHAISNEPGSGERAVTV
ncbi:MAG: ParB/RepB/Spo0J family partition protein [Deltaproteobacteria bacterium]|nr:ParB/RepB/Spo0J family partition protein [Deltaproteobacteria bacterium]